jgi:hypothetical protein
VERASTLHSARCTLTGRPVRTRPTIRSPGTGRQHPA